MTDAQVARSYNGGGPIPISNKLPPAESGRWSGPTLSLALGVGMNYAMLRRLIARTPWV